MHLKFVLSIPPIPAIRRSITAIARLAFALLLGSAMSLLPASSFDQEALVRLSDEAKQAMDKKNYQLAIEKLEQAMKIDPNYKKAREKLANAYNNYGLVSQDNPPEAIKYFRKAAMLDPNNATTLGNLSGIIQKMGKNPRDFATRVAMGKACQATADFPGAIVEFGEAVKIKDDAKIRERLGDIYRVRGEDDLAIVQYKAAARLKNSASIEAKLGQAYLSKKLTSKAKAAFSRAEVMKKKEPVDTDALVTGWREALKDKNLPEPGEMPVPVPHMEDSFTNRTRRKDAKAVPVPGWDEAVKEWSERARNNRRDSTEAK